ncbi:von Willebrand factor D and EGF domain-containing protein-like [Pecten maximus]|uniref:von Willebrand factor D and EGF domain-containing protein-like n=1 Tax=Pecten maximus TaxID=6579 RepID=UPI00145836D4|nr:von Willebrand factor D and EGF domain-containing protein-like [Pecten maximus]
MVDNLYDRDHSNHVTVQALVTYPRHPPIVTTTSLTLNIGRIDVVAKDNDHRAMCTSLNDPHITTFDGRRYDNFNTGEFVLYKHKTLPYEVRAQYQKCSSRHSRKNPSCNCAVAIKSGDDVITFSSCGSHGVTPAPQHGHHHDRHHHHQPAPTPITIQMFKNGNLTPGTVIRRLGCGQKYEVHLPTGTVVTIQSSARPFLNIWVKPSSLDYSQTEGLCGLYDRNRRNDVVHNNGRPFPDNDRSPDEFSMRWHVSTGASIFTGVPPATVPGITRFCSCVRGRPVFCVSSHGTMRCLETRYDITRTVVSQARLPQLGGRGRGKRQASITPDSPEVLPEITQNYTLAEAKDVCSSAIYNNSVTLQCDSVVNGSDISERIDNCAADLETTGDDVWALDSIKDIMEECLGEVEKTPVNGSNSSVPVIDTSNLCSEQCQNGNCTQGVCQCEPGFAGTDCSVSARNTTPTVNPRPADNTGCDVRHSSDKCQTVMILGQNFVESPTLTCHYTYIKVTSSVQRIGLETTVPANFTNMYQVSCRLPDANTGAFIRVSNDGITTSNDQYLHLVYDSICFDCTLANDTSASTCSRKTTGDDVWALDSIKDIMEECLGEVEKTPVNGSNSSVPVIDTSNLCSEQCQNGNCTQGVCQCEPGFAGTDCSVSARNTTPTVNPRPADNTGCDVRHSSDKCQTVMILGQNFVESPTLTCHYTYIKVTSSVQRIGLETTVPANFTNMYQVSCRLPDANTGAFIRVSNDGITTSNDQYLHLVYDSICFDCTLANDTSASTCSRKGDCCVIDKACYATDETKPGEKYQVCKPEVSSSSWTDTCNSDPACAPVMEASKQEDTFDQTEIVILAVVCGVLGLGLIVAVGHIIKSRSKAQNHKKYQVQEDKPEPIPEVAYDNKMYADSNYRM